MENIQSHGIGLKGPLGDDGQGWHAGQSRFGLQASDQAVLQAGIGAGEKDHRFDDGQWLRQVEADDGFGHFAG
ncbi:MAG: hypothetical protein K2H70_03070 [Bacteroidales bacterium]|nr:hypothetical protein [Bacteroidales bacterium]